MKAYRRLLVASLGCLLWTQPASAAPDGTLGMAMLGGLIVGSNAAITQGYGVTGASRINTGEYEVLFDRDVTKCIYSATSELFSAVTLAAAKRLDTPNGVFVEIRNSVDQLLFDANFYLLVFCAK